MGAHNFRKKVFQKLWKFCHFKAPKLNIIFQSQSPRIPTGEIRWLWNFAHRFQPENRPIIKKKYLILRSDPDIKVTFFSKTDDSGIL